jgi:hypothetical protein
MKTTLTMMLGALCGALVMLPQSGAAQGKDGFTKIFNGRDLTGWSGDPNVWTVEDGAIVGRTSADKPIRANTFLIWTNGEVADFELRLSFKILSGNSGIQYRSRVLDAAGWAVGGYQADLEAGTNYTGILYDERGVAGGRGIMAARGEKVLWDRDCHKQVTGRIDDATNALPSILPGHWSEYRIVARGNHLQHFINGHQTVDVTDACESKALRSGVLALQVHTGPPMTVMFKNLRLKKL